MIQLSLQIDSKINHLYQTINFLLPEEAIGIMNDRGFINSQKEIEKQPLIK